METNESYVFFRADPLANETLGPTGTLGVGLMPGANMAVDARLHGLGMPFYVAADPVRALLVASDTGGAIRGAARGDIFFGWGDDAQAHAGAMKAQGSMFVLLPRAVAARIGDRLAL